jgi:hypothetical protein
LTEKKKLCPLGENQKNMFSCQLKKREARCFWRFIFYMQFKGEAVPVFN